jgi:MFS transporter, ACS family, tartrate transporter
LSDSTPAPVDPASLARRVSIRMVFPLLCLYLLNSINRVNISFAAIHMNADLGLSPRAYGLGVSLFFAGYILLQLPSVWILQRVGMRRWLFGITALWGVCATGFAFMTSTTTFFTLRLLLGVAQGGFAPGLMLFLANWMPKQYRARAVSMVMLAVPLSIVGGGPLSGWLMSMHNPLGMAGWRWMILTEGVPTILLGCSVLWIFSDSPSEASWLSAAERDWLREELASERKSPQQNVTGRSLLVSAKVWAAAACWFSLTAGAYGVIYWLPQILKQVSVGISELQVGFVSSLPWLAAAVGMLVNSWHSDRTQERLFHVSLATVAAGIFLGLAAASGSITVALLCLALAGFSMGAGQSTFWTVPPLFLSAAALASGIAFINICGNVSGLVGPAAIGWIQQQTGSFKLPMLSLAGVMVVGGASLLWQARRQGK